MPHFFAIVVPLLYFLLACIGAGVAVLGFLPRRPQEPGVTEWALALLLGQGLFGSVLLIPALAGHFTLPVLLLMTQPFSCYGLWRLLRAARTLPAALRGAGIAFLKAPMPWKLVALALTALLLAWSAAIAGMIEGDAQAFYLALPKVIAASHRLVLLPAYEPFMNVGLLAEMQIAALFLLGMPDATPKLFGWVTILAGAVVLQAICRSAGLGRRGQMFSLAIVATSSAIALLLEGKSDFFAASYALCAVLCLQQCWGAASRRSGVVLVGLFTGFALVAKLSYVVAFLPTLAILLLVKEGPTLHALWSDRSRRRQIAQAYALDLLLVGAAMCVAFLPHLLKNLMLLGALGGPHASFEYFTPETTRKIVLSYPLGLVFGKYWGQLGNISPLLLAFLPLAWCLPRKNNGWSGPVAALFFSSIAGLVIWVFLFPAVPIPRYFMVNLLLLAVPAAWAADRLSRHNWAVNYAVGGAVLATVYASYTASSAAIFPVESGYRALFVKQSSALTPEQSGLTLNINEAYFRDGYEAINKVAKPGSRVFLASYSRFWLRADLIQTLNNDDENTLMRWDPKDPERLWRQLYQHGFSYLYMDGGQRLADALKAPPAWVTVRELFPNGAFFGKSYGSAYRLEFKDAPGVRMLDTVEVAPGAWNLVPAQPAAAAN